jgi:glyoxylase-like metal-dependent hydrolase (beta-lactamase superfamily II)
MRTRQPYAISRRQFVTLAGAGAAANTSSLRHRRQSRDHDPARGRHCQHHCQPTTGNVSVLMGSGGNIAVLPGHDGKLLVDSGFLVSRSRIVDALASLSSDPIKHLINTHWHFDHTDGNEWLHSAGATAAGEQANSSGLTLGGVRFDTYYPMHLNR